MQASRRTLGNPFPGPAHKENIVIKPSVLSALNAQIQHELSNAHAYRTVSLYFGHLNLRGLESFMARQATEERMHAEKFIRHLAARGGQTDLGSMPATKADFASVLDAVHAVRDLERATTDKIYRLFDLARRESDFALEVLLHWFIAEQVEEEQWSGELAALAGQLYERPGELFLLDHQWGKRVEEFAK
jgi:ferritin